MLPPSSLSIVYALPVKSVVERFKMLILNALLLNLLSAIVLFTLAWLFERKMFLPAEDNAFRTEEHEQFNRKIVASAPVGICILRISDGTNILSNELAHNYINLLTHEDRDRITRIICEQQANFVDVMTSNNNNLQISFVHSRYRNEDVAICVLVDVSARVKMEESLQEMAAAAEQASQSKSMFPPPSAMSCARRCTALSATSICCKPRRCRRGRSAGQCDEQLFRPAAENHQRYSRFLQNRVRAAEDRTARVLLPGGDHPYRRQLFAAGG